MLLWLHLGAAPWSPAQYKTAGPGPAEPTRETHTKVGSDWESWGVLGGSCFRAGGSALADHTGCATLLGYVQPGLPFLSLSLPRCWCWWDWCCSLCLQNP